MEITAGVCLGRLLLREQVNRNGDWQDGLVSTGCISKEIKPKMF